MSQGMDNLRRGSDVALSQAQLTQAQEAIHFLSTLPIPSRAGKDTYDILVHRCLCGAAREGLYMPTAASAMLLIIVYRLHRLGRGTS